MLKDVISERRKELGISMRELASAVGVSEPTVSRWESGNIATMKLSTMKKVAKVLSIPNSIIFGVDEDDVLDVLNKCKKYKYIPKDATINNIDSFLNSKAIEEIIIPNIALGDYAGDKSVFFMHVRTEGVNNIIPKGSLIAIKRDILISSLLNDDLVLVSTDEGIQVRKVEHLQNQDFILFKPDSTDKGLPSLITKLDDTSSIIGKVISCNVLL